MNSKMAKTSFILFIITIVSKVVAFFVTIVFSYYFGTNAITDAYYAAGTIPNLVNNSLTICALTLFIPIYTKCRSEAGNHRAEEFASNVFNAFVIFNIALFVAVSLAAPVLARITAPGFSEEGLMHTERMIRLLSMSFPFTVAAYTLNNLYNGNQKYVLPAVLTLLNHIFVIIFNIILAPAFGIYSYPFICTGAWVVQLIILYFCAKGRLFYHKLTINIKDKYFTYMLKQSVPVMVTTAADQINLAADNIISSDLPGGSLSCLGYAHRIFYSINGIVTSTLLTIYYPIISRQYAEKETKGLNRSLRVYFEIMLLLTLPVTFLLVGNSEYIIRLLFGRGAMREEDVFKISILFIIYVCGLIFISIKEFVTRLFYIIGDTRQPTIINILCVGMNICLSVALKQFWGIYGIAIATTISIAVFSGVECLFLIKKVGGINALKRHEIVDIKGVMQIVIACTMAMIVMIFIQKFFGFRNILIYILLSGGVYVIVLFLVLYVFKNKYINIVVVKFLVNKEKVK